MKTELVTDDPHVRIWLLDDPAHLPADPRIEYLAPNMTVPVQLPVSGFLTLFPWVGAELPTPSP